MSAKASRLASHARYRYAQMTRCQLRAIEARGDGKKCFLVLAMTTCLHSWSLLYLHCQALTHTLDHSEHELLRSAGLYGLEPLVTYHM